MFQRKAAVRLYLSTSSKTFQFAGSLAFRSPRPSGLFLRQWHGTTFENLRSSSWTNFLTPLKMKQTIRNYHAPYQLRTLLIVLALGPQGRATWFTVLIAIVCIFALVSWPVAIY